VSSPLVGGYFLSPRQSLFSSTLIEGVFCVIYSN
jgi:hypothetical protein